MKTNFLLATLVVFGFCNAALAVSPRLEGIACRSVHLRYTAPPGGHYFYNEVTVRESHPGTYFCVCGFNMGYYGIQELANGKKVLIFSIWDPGRPVQDPDEKEFDQRVKLLHQDAAVRIGRFGNEGTGGQSFYDYDWKVGETYRFAVRSRTHDRRTSFDAFFYHPEEKKWKHLVTFERHTEGQPLEGYYSFVEDFRRNRVSATLTRTAIFGNAWVQDVEGNWHWAKSARFTADGNPVKNINAGLKDSRFFLSTGGDIENDETPLGEAIVVAGPKPEPPQDLP